MKRLIVVGIICLLFIVVSAFWFINFKTDTETSMGSRFVMVENGFNTNVVYDRYTKVMYVQSGKFFTMLVDADGKPLLYENKE